MTANSELTRFYRHQQSQQMTKPDDRQRILIQTRNLKMAQSAHAYVRGSTVKFYEWLEGSRGKLPEGPAVWICGDCHIGNLGPLSDVKGRVKIQIRDLDQTVIGNPAHDLIRLWLIAGVSGSRIRSAGSSDRKNFGGAHRRLPIRLVG
jgi:uncharacterized protein (DUF2252 family)